MIDLVVLSPAYFAARGLVPTVRRFKPQVVLNNNHHTRQATASAMKKPRWKRIGDWKELRNLGSFLDDRADAAYRLSLGASSVRRAAIRSDRNAIQFIMIVLITSCPPVLAFKKPGTNPQSAPPSGAAKKRQRHMDVCGQTGDRITHKGRAGCPNKELTFNANVEQTCSGNRALLPTRQRYTGWHCTRLSRNGLNAWRICLGIAQI